VTGTNGKTTTTEWIGHIHRTAGLPVAVAGNVGTALSGLVGELAQDATVICEASSFQLEDAIAFAPEAAVLLNLSPDHLDRHGSYDSYVAAKLAIFAHQLPGDVAVLPDDLDVQVAGRATQVRFGARAAAGVPAHICAGLWLRGGGLRWDGHELVRVAELPLPGAHNLQNAMAAAAACLARGLDREAVAAGLRTFAGVAHRLELVAERDGVRYRQRLQGDQRREHGRRAAAFPGGVHLIAGGRGKGRTSRLSRRSSRERCAAVYLIGEAAAELEQALAGTGVPLHGAGDLVHAVALAARGARRGEVVLLSPACKPAMTSTATSRPAARTSAGSWDRLSRIWGWPRWPRPKRHHHQADPAAARAPDARDRDAVPARVRRGHGLQRLLAARCRQRPRLRHRRVLHLSGRGRRSGWSGCVYASATA
jgi:UDP-N-acetylmuramoylalanine--D-glutamate ligase